MAVIQVMTIIYELNASHARCFHAWCSAILHNCGF